MFCQSEQMREYFVLVSVFLMFIVFFCYVVEYSSSFYKKYILVFYSKLSYVGYTCMWVYLHLRN